MRLLPLVAGLLLTPALAAQDLATDRPDLTESAVTVPRGRLQLELGATYERAGGASVRSGPELLVRYAPGARFELRFEAPDVVGAGGATGLGDVAAGFKTQLGPAWGWDAAVIAMASLPTGGGVFGAGRVVPAVTLTAGRALAPGVSVGVQAAGAAPGDGADVLGTVVVGADLGRRAGTFVEVAARWAGGAPAAVLAHHGYTLALGPNLQADVHGGLGLTARAPDAFVGVGLGVRF